MKMMSKLAAGVMATVMIISGFSVTTFAADGLRAFPDAEGGGMYTLGARAASSIDIYHVTNLNDSGAGSFRDAVSQSNRIIVFDVAGTIMLENELKISSSNLTILGQTAPGEGICIAGESVRFQGSSNIIMRYLRFRSGDTALSEEDGLGFRDCTDVIVDHCSVSWSVDECLSAYANRNFTVQYCILSESLNNSIHGKGAHGYGGIWGGENASFHHNLLATHNSRMPRIGTSATVSSYNGNPDTDSLVDIRNNVFYNWGSNSGYGGENGIRVNFVNNYYKPGPATDNIWFYQNWGTTLHVSGNVMEGNASMTNDNWTGITIQNDSVEWTKCESISDGIMVDGVLKANDEFIYDYPVTTSDAETAYVDVLKKAGASLWRDVTDTRVVNSVINGTATNGSNGSVGLIDSQEDVGSWVWLYEGIKPADSDNDGMSDAWEDARGLNKNDASDATVVTESGYTNLELYAESIVGHDNSLDRTGLNSAINKAIKLDRSIYETSELERLDTVIEEAKGIYAMASAQTELDNATDSLNAVISGLGLNIQERLRILLKELEGTTSKSYYLPAGEKIFNEAYSKAETDLENGADESVLENDYNNLRQAYESLIPSDEEKLRDAINNASNYINSGEYGESDIADLRNAVAAADGMLSTSDNYTNEDINYHINTIQSLIDELLNLNRTVMDEYIDILENGVLNAYALSSNSVDRLEALLSEARELKAKGANETDAREFAVKMFAESRSFDYKDYKEILNLENFNEYIPTSTSKVVTEGDNSYLAPVSEEVFYINTDGISSDDYFSSEFMFPSSKNVGYCQAIGFAFEDGFRFLVHVSKNANDEDSIALNYYNTETFEITGNSAYYLSIADDVWHNITISYDSETGFVELYYDNLMVYSGTPDGFGTGHGKVTMYGTVDTVYEFMEGFGIPMYGSSDVYVDNYMRYRAGKAWTDVLGDADVSGLLTSNDCSVILKKVFDSAYLMPVEKCVDDYLSCVDVTEDGVLTADDAAAVLQRVLYAD